MEKFTVTAFEWLSTLGWPGAERSDAPELYAAGTSQAQPPAAQYSKLRHRRSQHQIASAYPRDENRRAVGPTVGLSMPSEVNDMKHINHQSRMNFSCRRTLCRRSFGSCNLVSLLAIIGCGLICGTAQSADAPTRILILVGPSSHPPGTHEVAAGGRLVEHCLEHADNVHGIQADVRLSWPNDRQLLEGIAAVVFSGDRFPPEEMPDSDRIMADLSQMMDRGCGIVCFHYATGLGANHVAPNGDHPLLRWMGGYFATGCPHHQSIAKIFPAATVEPAQSEHPVVRGWKPFTLHDEPYIKNYFGPEGPAKNVTPLATSLLPPESPQREVVAWAVSRPDGGRGVGVVMPHFYRNWQIEDLRMLILNGIVWSAKREVPADGVRTRLPLLSAFEPGAVEPQSRPKK